MHRLSLYQDGIQVLQGGIVSLWPPHFAEVLFYEHILSEIRGPFY